MPDGDGLTDFLFAATEARLRMVRNGEHTQEIQGYLGPDAYAEYKSLADNLGGAHLSVSAPTNLIFVPGIMGSELLSKTKGGVWWIDLRGLRHIDELGLSPDGRSDANPDNRIEAFTTDPQYEPFLAAVLARDDFGHETFPFDWRKSPAASAAALRDLVQAVHQRNGGAPIHLVGHSMGGLVVRAALMAHGNELWPLLGRVVFLGTPHYGSPAIAGYLKNHLWGFELLAVLGAFLSRATFRSLWGVLSMLPAPCGVYPGTRANDADPWRDAKPGDTYAHPCSNFDFYDATSWKLGLNVTETERLQGVLNGCRRFHQQLQEAHTKLTPDQHERLMIIAGVGYRTLFRLTYKSRLFGAWTSMVKTTSRISGDPHREGDGRVPLASATLDNVGIRYVRAAHGGLPNVPAVYEGLFRYLNNDDPELPNSPEAALEAHLGGDGQGSAAPHLDGSARAQPFSDDPGLWEEQPPDPARLQQLVQMAEGGSIPEFTRVRLL
jgi:triacylglycerol esterase/lipase EstA (alpha/beta hydrolase family)